VTQIQKLRVGLGTEGGQLREQAALELAKMDSLYADKLTAAGIPYAIDEVPVLPNLLQLLGFHQGAGIGATICKYGPSRGPGWSREKCIYIHLMDFCHKCMYHLCVYWCVCASRER
jgi:hypothetical protein